MTHYPYSVAACGRHIGIARQLGGSAVKRISSRLTATAIDNSLCEVQQSTMRCIHRHPLRPPMIYTQALAALSYRAPFLVEKLQKERIVCHVDEAQLLFDQVLKYLVLECVYPTKQWAMYSRRVDEVWHQFMLFTVEYERFCLRYFGHYVHHAPDRAHGRPEKTTPEADSGTPPFSDFRSQYEHLFQVPIPDVWLDSKSITLDRRVLVASDVAGLCLGPAGDLVRLHCNAGLVCSAHKVAAAVLEFVAGTDAFYVRELPAGLTEAEKIAMVETLVTRGVLRVAA
jgi:hypothetical protein